MDSTAPAAPHVGTPAKITPELLARLDVSGPRYTSYPTADRFVDAFTHDDYKAALQQCRQHDSDATKPLSVYVHIPFCESLCYYCACNKIITRKRDQGTTYLDYLRKELTLLVKQIGPDRPVSQLHLGGGTPTFLSNEELAALMQALRDSFGFVPEGEYAIEIDPRTVNRQRLHALWQAGFNRMSLGVQDFDPAVQAAMHRLQPLAQVREVIEAGRVLGFPSINVDLIYGLPKQTVESFTRTIDQVCQLRPDRIALYAYAHLPERFMSQRRIAAADLPAPAVKLQLLALSIERLLAAGYVYVGMDHFALHDDSLAIAKREGKLHRNFQGYTTQPDCDLVALGVSGIGRVGNTYSQNAKTLDDYCQQLDQGKLPVVRGLILNADDLLRRDVIQAIMCQGHVDFAAVSAAHKIDFDAYFAAELAALQPLQAQGLVRAGAGQIDVTELGWFFVRAVAMVFDRYLHTQRSNARFSRII
ncbi:MAG: oxygen-independent coproporphyrinogen III oxidase [Burkholderiaceae bacterium]|jgi:oxygen-independent coproporphyrinogen-3 oxidase|nr:oxygen-independent coproporphyrinogen III oxidase [Burkholderiaceae bacterium]